MTDCSCAVTCLELCVDTLGKLLSVRLEKFSGRLKRFEVMLVADLSVSYSHEVSHYAHQTCIIPV